MKIFYTKVIFHQILFTKISVLKELILPFIQKSFKKFKKGGKFLLSYELNHVSEKLLQNIFGFDEKENLSLQSRMNI